MKRVWILNQYASPPEYEVRVRNNMMGHYLNLSGKYEVTIIGGSNVHNTGVSLIDDFSLFKKRKYQDLNFIHVNISPYKGNGLKRVFSMLEFPFKLCKLYKKFGELPDLIICDLDAIFFPFVKYLSNRIKCPVYIEVRDLWPASISVYKNISDKSLLMRALYRLERNAYIKADRVIFSMEGGYNYIIDKKWNNLISKNKVHYINNGIDLESFERNKSFYKYKNDELHNDENFKVFYVGSIRIANGVDKIIEVAEYLLLKNEKVSFYIFGDGDCKDELEMMCKRKGIENVKFMGMIDKKFVPSALELSDLNIIHFKNSVLKRYGASLNKLFEYLASGKPIISDCIFYKDIIKEYNCGYSIEGEYEEIAEAILNIMNKTDLEYKKICDNCIKASKEFDYKKLTNKLMDLLDKDLGGK